MSRVLVLCGSERKNGNTELLVQAFFEAAAKKHEVEVISVADVRVNLCTVCNACQVRTDHSCVQEDDMTLIYEKLMKAEIVIIASPVYFYGINARLKAIVDRLHTPMRERFAVKKLGLILVGAAVLPHLFDPILLQYQMILDFFHLEDAGKVLVRGVRDKGDVRDTDAPSLAYALGLSI